MSSYDLYHGTKGIDGTTEMHNVGVKVEVSLNIYVKKPAGYFYIGIVGTKRLI